AVHLNAEIAIRHQVGRKPALDEQDVGAGLQPLETDGNLELARADLEERRETGVEIGVLEDRRAGPEVRHDPEVELAEHGAFEGRAHAPQDERVGRRARPVVAIEAAVELHVAAQLEQEGAVVRLEREAVLGVRGRLGAGLRLLGFRLFVDLGLAVEDADLLIELLDLLFEALRRVGGRCFGFGYLFLPFRGRGRFGGSLGTNGSGAQEPEGAEACEDDLRRFHLEFSVRHAPRPSERTIRTGAGALSIRSPTTPPKGTRRRRAASGAPSTRRSWPAASSASTSA